MRFKDNDDTAFLGFAIIITVIVIAGYLVFWL